MRQAFHEYLEMLFIIFVIVFVGKKKKFVIIYFPDDKFRLVFMENSGNSDKLNNCRLTRDNHIDSSKYLCFLDHITMNVTLKNLCNK